MKLITVTKIGYLGAAENVILSFLEFLFLQT